MMRLNLMTNRYSKVRRKAMLRKFDILNEFESFNETVVNTETYMTGCSWHYYKHFEETNYQGLGSRESLGRRYKP